jgi:hypothetical protein
MESEHERSLDATFSWDQRVEMKVLREEAEALVLGAGPQKSAP